MRFHLLPIIAALCLSGCAAATTKVTRFHQLPAKGSGQTFTILPPTRYGSQIELAGYNARIAAHLEKYGWRRASSAKADCAVGYEYGISDRKRVDSAVPIFGQTGGGTTYHTGSVNSYGTGGARYSGTSYTPSTYGMVGSIPISQMIYGRWLLIVARDRHSKELFEIRCESSGTASEISQVLPAMIDSAFADFPGVSGKTKSYTKSF